MDLILLGLLIFVVGIVLTLALPHNKIRVTVNVLSQTLACGLILAQTVPILLGAEPMTAEIPWSYPVERIDLRLDSLGAFFLTFSLPLTLLSSFYGLGYLAHDIRSPRHVGAHFALLSTVQISYLIVYTVQNSFAFLVGWEVNALAAWLLIIWEHRNQKVRFAGFNYLISTHLSLLFLVAGIMIIHGDTGSFQFADFEAFLSQPGPQRDIAFVLLMTAFGLKAAFFPFHVWLPRAHGPAPAHISALLSGVNIKAGLFGMLKFILMVGRPDPWMGWYLIGVSALAAFMGVLYTLFQRDIKRLLGYSSTENVGIAGIGVGLGCLGLALNQPVLAGLGFAGGMLHIVNHALFKCLLFYGAGAVYRFTHTIDMEKLGGLLKVMRWTGPLFLIGCLASAALPPFNGFVSEFLLYVGLMRPNQDLGLARMPLMLTAGVLALVGGLSAMSITRAFGLVFLGSPRHEQHSELKAREHAWMIVPMVLLVLAIAAIGLVPVLGLRLVEVPTGMLLGKTSAPDVPLESYVPIELLHALSRIAAVLLGVLGLLLLARLVLLPRCQRRHVTWGCGYTAGNRRMQYTGSSFSQAMALVFGDVLEFETREETPKDVFPKDGKYETHCVDTVERTMFKVLADTESAATDVMRRVPEDARFSFGLGLVALVLLVTLVCLGGAF